MEDVYFTRAACTPKAALVGKDFFAEENIEA
jgi:hypothetical protein